MALEKVITQDKIEIVGDHKMVQVRTKTTVMEDGVELSSGFHRHVVAPNADITGERQRFNPSVMQFTRKRSRMPMPHI